MITRIQRYTDSAGLSGYRGKSGGGGTQTTVTEKNVDPWSGVQPYMKDVFRQAQNQYRNGKPEYFPNQTYADFSPQTQQALQMQQNTALGNPLDQYASMEAQKTLGGGYLNANPYLDQMADIAASKAQNAVSSQFSQAGRYGSPAMARATAEGVSNAVLPMYGQAYNQERENMQRSLALSPQVNQLQYQDPAQLANVGQMYENQTQKGINEDINRFNFYQNRDQDALARYNQMIQGGMNFSSGSSTSTQPLYGQSPLAGAVGGGLAGAGLASALEMSTPWGAALGAGAGLLGLF